MGRGFVRGAVFLCILGVGILVTESGTWADDTPQCKECNTKGKFSSHHKIPGSTGTRAGNRPDTAGKNHEGASGQPTELVLKPNSLNENRVQLRTDLNRQKLEDFQNAIHLERQGRMEEALIWYKSSARAGYGPAQKRLGIIYGGVGVPRDYAQAIYWDRMAKHSGETIEFPYSFSSSGAFR